MRVDSNADIAGIPAIKVRDYMRDVQRHRFGADNIAYGLKILVAKARAVIKELLACGYISGQQRQALPPLFFPAQQRTCRFWFRLA